MYLSSHSWNPPMRLPLQFRETRPPHLNRCLLLPDLLPLTEDARG
jgi:hypothetical protein